MQFLVISNLLLCSVFLLAHNTVLQATAEDTTDEDKSATHTVTVSLLEIQSSLRMLLSESNRQNQDLEMLKDDMGALKFGFAILQHTTNELRSEMDTQHHRLWKEMEQTQDCLEDFRNDTEQRLESIANSLGTLQNDTGNSVDSFMELGVALELSSNDTRRRLTLLQEDVSGIEECLNDTKDKLDTLQSDVSDIGDCLETTKNDTKDRLVMLQYDMSNIGDCVEITKNDTKDRLVTLQSDVNNIGDSLETTKNDTKDRLVMLQSDVQDIGDCLEITKNDTKDRLETLQGDVGDIEVCVETTKNTTEDIIIILNRPGLTRSDPATSCSEILQAAPQSPSDLYWIRGTDNTIIQLFCDMDFQCPVNDTEPTGWIRVASIDMTDPTNNCPSELTELTNPLRVCAKDSSTDCLSSIFPVQGVEYSRVCGRIIGYQDGRPDAFFSSDETIDATYIDGISLTYGQSPRNHIWTFAAALDEVGASPTSLCPCTNNTLSDQASAPPAFVGNDYFCDTGSNETDTNLFHDEDPLWDGAGCGPNNDCCTFNNPPWFSKEISPPTTEDIEMRLCSNASPSNEDVNFEMLDIYIQ